MSVTNQDNSQSKADAGARNSTEHPTPYELSRLALGVLKQGIVKEGRDLDADDFDADDSGYDPEFDPLAKHPNYRQAVAEALKLWDTGVQTLAERMDPGPFKPLMDNIFEAPKEWEKRYGEVIEQGFNPDEALFRAAWPAEVVAENLYSETTYTPIQMLQKLQELVKRSRQIRFDRWKPTKWERKLLADPYGRNQLVPISSKEGTVVPSTAEDGIDGAQPPSMPLALFGKTNFNGIEIRALLGEFGVRAKVRSLSASKTGKKGGRPPKAAKRTD